MVQRYEVRGKELGGDAFYEDWVEVVRKEDYVNLELKLADALAYLKRANSAMTTDLRNAYMRQAIGILIK